ncbi:MAG: hypothetical protein EON54_05700 [Alcaligenaceae bacterium]|nr:MAG: hypothetical protein EON54_05700 [Alcaligenaceae bacterium]
MSTQVAHGGPFDKLFWIWLGLLTSVFVFWRLRGWWLKRRPRPAMEVKTKYSRRLAKRLRVRQAMRTGCQDIPKLRPRRRP